MTAQLINGNTLSAQIRQDIRAEATKLSAQGLQPGLAVILVGDNPASQVYVRNKVSAVFDKLEVASRAQAIVLARNAGFGTGPLPD